jgi:hypothetical protein
MADDHIPHAHFLEGSFHYLALKNEILNGAKKKRIQTCLPVDGGF